MTAGGVGLTGEMSEDGVVALRLLAERLPPGHSASFTLCHSASLQVAQLLANVERVDFVLALPHALMRPSIL